MLRDSLIAITATVKDKALRALEKAMRRRVKTMLYKRLYGGRWTRRDALCCAVYRRLPGAHPLVLTTLEGR